MILAPRGRSRGGAEVAPLLGAAVARQSPERRQPRKRRRDGAVETEERYSRCSLRSSSPGSSLLQSERRRCSFTPADGLVHLGLGRPSAGSASQSAVPLCWLSPWSARCGYSAIQSIWPSTARSELSPPAWY